MSKQEQVKSSWIGRNLENYIRANPKAKGAKTLTQARALAFGKKAKNFGCRCGQKSCSRQEGGKSSCGIGVILPRSD